MHASIAFEVRPQQVPRLAQPVDDGGHRNFHHDPVLVQHARQHWSQRVLLDGGSDGNVLSAMTRWVISMARAMPIVLEPPRPSFAELDAIEAGGSGSLVAFRSPYSRNRTAAVVTVAGGGTVAEAVRRMVEPDVWNRLDGDVSVWSGESGEVLSHRVAAPYVIREVEKSPRHLWLLWRTFMAERPGYWLILAFGLVLILTLVTGRLLRRRARRIDG